MCDCRFEYWQVDKLLKFVTSHLWHWMIAVNHQKSTLTEIISFVNICYTKRKLLNIVLRYFSRWLKIYFMPDLLMPGHQRYIFVLIDKLTCRCNTVWMKWLSPQIMSSMLCERFFFCHQGGVKYCIWMERVTISQFQRK